MKTKQIINLIAFVFAVIGVFLKHMHLPGGNIILLLSYALLFYGLLRYALADNNELGLNKALNYLMVGALTIFLVTLLFKSMHWPGAKIIGIAASLLILITSGALVFSKEGLKISKQYLIAFFVFILLLDGVFQRTGWGKIKAIQRADQMMVSAIAPTKMNVLYIGVENPIKVAVSGIDMNNIEVKTDVGTLTGTNGNYFISLLPDDINKQVKITIIRDGIALDSSVFRVKLIPDPIATVAGIQNGLISKDILLNQKGLVAELPDFAFDMGFTITEFILVVNSGDGLTYEVPSKTSEFTQEQIDYIKKLKTDDKMIMEEIKAVGANGAIVSLKPMVLKLK